jgi:hypothetical protein
VTSDAPIARLKGWDSDVLAIRNTDSESLNDLDITIYGLVTTETSVHRPTGAYRLRKGAGTTDGQLMTFSLNDFQKPSGESWVPLTMSVAEINLRASVRGEFCSADIRPHASVMDVIGR